MTNHNAGNHRDNVGQSLEIGDRVARIDKTLGAVLDSQRGTVVGFGPKNIKVVWDEHRWQRDPRDRARMVSSDRLRKIDY